MFSICAPFVAPASRRRAKVLFTGETPEPRDDNSFILTS